jgi:Na+-transporting NADH:ubiquinone oxidoreductase subunit NqrB
MKSLSLPLANNPIVDARWYQIIFLSSFLTFGIVFLDWKADWIKYFTLIITCQAVQWFWIWKTGASIHTLKSAAITSLGLSLLLKTNLPYVAIFAALVAISSKFIFKFNNKHFFNPANIGLIAAILITHQAWVSPGQWGREALMLLLFMGLGLTVVGKVGRMDTSITFLLTLAVLNGIRWNVHYGWPLDLLGHKMLNGTTLLFAFFMITDPRSIPDHRFARIVWTMAVAGLTFYLTNYQQMAAGAIWALFILSPLTPILDYFFKAKRFEWLPATIK